MNSIKYKIVNALRATAKQLDSGKPYEWGHMGSCNCGNLAQTVLNINKDTIHRSAMEKHGDWNEQLNDYCPTSGLLIDKLIWGLIEYGFEMTDLMKLENLSDYDVLQHVDENRKPLEKNVRADVVTYLYAWANLVEEKLVDAIELNLDIIPNTNKIDQYAKI